MGQFAYVAGFVVESAWGILPVFVLSVSLGVLVRALRLDGAVRRAFASRVGLSVLLATAIGAFSPFCSCTVIPIVAGLLIGGVPLAPVMAFWVACHAANGGRGAREVRRGAQTLRRREGGNPDSAEDVVQDVYLKIQTRIGTVEAEERVGAWVYRVARNAVYDFYRARKPTQELDETSSPIPDPADDEMEARLSEAVRGMLDGLSPDQKTALYLTEYEGMTQRDLAAELGISVSGAKSRVQRARARLKALLLDCCQFELDRRGKVINYYGRERTSDPHPGTP
jgi:RNA polymerase sigma-70 factor (ECF subfamily)